MWITEFADSSPNAGGEGAASTMLLVLLTASTGVDIATFMAAALNYLDEQSWIERYSWFAFAVRALTQD